MNNFDEFYKRFTAYRDMKRYGREKMQELATRGEEMNAPEWREYQRRADILQGQCDTLDEISDLIERFLK